MKLLLDTQAFIWWDSEPGKLSVAALAACLDPANALLLSAASVWEIQIKLQLGKLTLKQPLAEIIVGQMQTNGVEVLSVTLQHVLALSALHAHHKDPFDRILIAQANHEHAILVSNDPIIAKYSAKLLW